MKLEFLIIMIILGSLLPSRADIRYHKLEFTSSEPRITQRCVDSTKIEGSGGGFIRESFDSLNRCNRLEFFKSKNVYFRAVDFPSIVRIIWTDSSLIVILFESDGSLFSSESMVRPNKVEYFLKDSTIVKEKDFFNGHLVASKKCDNKTINDVFFLMYSGCEKRYNKKYRLKF